MTNNPTRRGFHRACAHAVATPAAVALLVFGATIGACRTGAKPSDGGGGASAPNEVASAYELRPEFVPLAQLIAREYREKYTVTNPAPLMAPWLCSAPPVSPLHSAARGEDAHGRKLYFLFASDAKPFLRLAAEPKPDARAPQGLSLVKETWHAEPIQGGVVDRPMLDFNAVLPYEFDIPRPPRPRHPDGWHENFTRTTGGWATPSATCEVNGETYSAGAQGDLFIMTRLSRETPGTDGGWVYATVRPDTLEVTAAGRVQTCMRCHEQAPHDRLFVATQDDAALRLRVLDASEKGLSFLPDEQKSSALQFDPIAAPESQPGWSVLLSEPLPPRED